MQITYYVAASLDGFIAKEDGDVSWLEELDIPFSETGYDEYFETVDAIVMGRKTYEIICSFAGWPYGNKPVWICSRDKSILPVEGCNLQPGKSPEDVMELAKQMKINHLWLVGGGQLATSFLEKNMLNKIILSHMPIILGSGIKLFGDIAQAEKVKFERYKSYPSGFLQSQYSINKAKP